MVDDKSNRTIEAYDSVASHYAEYSQNRSNYLKTVEELVISHLGVGQRLLDIGSGDGRRLKKIIDNAKLKEVIAIEPSKKMVEICKEKLNIEVFNCLAEDLDKLDLGKFEVVTLLWNVFGHIPSREARLKSLLNIREKMLPESLLILDINNRHNAASYGKFRVWGRVVLDAVCFKEERGDATYYWKIGEKSFKTHGHLFIPLEFERLVREAGFTIKSRLSVDYKSGKVSKSRFRGQLFYVLKKR